MTDSGVLRSRSSNARQARKTVNRHRPLEFGSELQVSSQDRLLQFQVVIFHPTVETLFAHGSRCFHDGSHTALPPKTQIFVFSDTFTPVINTAW